MLMDTVVYTIGYGSRSLRDLVAILDAYGVEFLVDVRSYPHSRFNPEYNKRELIGYFDSHRIQYVSGETTSAAGRTIPT